MRDNNGSQIYDGYGGQSITYSNIQGGYPGTGNIDADPIFFDTGYWDDNGTPGNPFDDIWMDGDYHLTFNSPCRGSGDNTVPGLPDTDFEGDPRIFQGSVDMDADEFCTHLYCTGDSTPGEEMKGKLVGLPSLFPVGLFFGSNKLPSPIHTAWGEFYLLPPWFLVPLAPIPSNGILSLTTRIPSSPPAPYDIYMQALIGMNPDSLSNLYVLQVK